MLTRTVLIPFQKLEKKHNFEEAYKFSAEISSQAKNARNDFGTILTMGKDVVNIIDDKWMSKISDILTEKEWSVRDQLNYGVYIFATAKVS